MTRSPRHQHEGRLSKPKLYVLCFFLVISPFSEAAPHTGSGERTKGGSMEGEPLETVDEFPQTYLSSVAHTHFLSRKIRSITKSPLSTPKDFTQESTKSAERFGGGTPGFQDPSAKRQHGCQYEDSTAADKTPVMDYGEEDTVSPPVSPFGREDVSLNINVPVSGLKEAKHEYIQCQDGGALVESQVQDTTECSTEAIQKAAVSFAHLSDGVTHSQIFPETISADMPETMVDAVLHSTEALVEDREEGERAWQPADSRFGAVKRRAQYFNSGRFPQMEQYIQYLNTFAPNEAQQQQLQQLQQAIGSGIMSNPAMWKRLQRRAQASAYASAVSNHPLIQGAVGNAYSVLAEALSNVSLADILQAAVGGPYMLPLPRAPGL